MSDVPRILMPTPYFSWDETYRTDVRALLPENGQFAVKHWQKVIAHAELMHTVRVALRSGVIVNSWVRCPALNRAIGGVDNSDHTPLEDRVGATDFTCPGFGTPYEVAKFLADPKNGIKFRQLIYEHSWVHISSPRLTEAVPRMQILTLARGGRYIPGIVKKGD